MVKKKIIISIVVMLEVGFCLFLVLTNTNSFITSTNRLLELSNIPNIKNYFQISNDNSNVIYNEVINDISDKIDTISSNINIFFNRPFGDIMLDIIDNALTFVFNFIIYFCNYGLTIILVLYLFLHETFNGTQLDIRTTPLAYFYIKVDNLRFKIRGKIVSLFSKLKEFIHRNKRIIFLLILGLLIANGFIYRLLIEFIFFIITYIIYMFNLEIYILVFDIFKFLFLHTVPYLKYIPLWILIPVLIVLIFLIAVNKANYKLKKNHQRLKMFVKDELTQTCFINGCPGTGKTLLNMSLSLACEENYIEELEEKLLDYETKYRNINFAKIREEPDKYLDHQEYIDIYNLLTYRKSFIISNYAIYSPLYNSYSKIFDFNYMRVNKRADVYPLDEYIVISISEFDKEYNSHDDKKVVGEDGAATFFSTVSHDLKRHAKIFVDYQLRQQVPLRIRGNSEYFITIKKRLLKYPLLLMVYYLPFKILYSLSRYYLKRYETKRLTISRRSNRKGPSIYKRNDLTLPYLVVRSIANTLSKICKWFDMFYYYKLNTTISQEDENNTATKGIKKSLCINIRDLTYNNQKLYDSTFLSYSYAEKKNYEFKDLDTFTKLSPPKEELAKCHSRFYDKINN